MLILMDTHPGSLLQIVEHLKGHELMRTERYVHEGGTVTEVELNFVVVDVPMAVGKDGAIEEAINRFYDSCILPEIVISISQVPPWQRKSTEDYLAKLPITLETIGEIDDDIKRGVNVTWYTPEDHQSIKKISNSYLKKNVSRRIVLKNNNLYEKVRDQNWRILHSRELNIIAERLPLHFIEDHSISPQLTALIRELRDLSDASPEDVGTKTKPEHIQSLDSLAGKSASISKTKELLLRVAKAGPGLNVMLVGETGTGKEVAASIVHKCSTLKDKPFKALNCGGMNRDLIEAQLFGYIKGAFTGAIHDFEGMIGQIDSDPFNNSNDKAYAGTLFLDELHDLPEATQGLLLRFLESGDYRRFGDTKDRHAKIRIIAALQPGKEKRGKLRDDLYNRLAEVEVRMPILNERRDDIPWIAQYLLEKLTEAEFHYSAIGEEGVVDLNRVESILSNSEFIKQLKAHDWSQGNVRELRNVLKRAALLGEFEVSKHSDELPYNVLSLPESLSEVVPAKVFRDKYMEAIYSKFKALGVTDREIADKLDCDSRTLRSARGEPQTNAGLSSKPRRGKSF